MPFMQETIMTSDEYDEDDPLVEAISEAWSDRCAEQLAETIQSICDTPNSFYQNPCSKLTRRSFRYTQRIRIMRKHSPVIALCAVWITAAILIIIAVLRS